MVGLYISYDIYHKKKLKCNLILFGCPPPGDYNFKIMYDKYLYDNNLIINNNNDILAFPLFGNYKYNIYLIKEN